jgi:hypothetical protein
MSTISVIYDALYEAIETLFPDRIQLPDSRNIDQNPDPILKNGYGVTWESGDLTDELQGRAYFDERNIGVILTNRVARLDTSATADRAVEKALFEDRKSLIDYLKTNKQILKAAEFFEATADEGIQSVEAEKQNIIYLKINFTTRYMQVLNS